MPVEGENEGSPMVHQQTTDIIREWLMTKFGEVTGGDSQTLFFFSARFRDRRENLELRARNKMTGERLAAFRPVRQHTDMHGGTNAKNGFEMAPRRSVGASPAAAA